MAAVREAPFAVESDLLTEIAENRGLQPEGLVERLSQFQQHWRASDFLEKEGTPWGASPVVWYLTVPTDKWEEHARATDTEAYEWLAVHDVYQAVYEKWSTERSDAHDLMAADTAIIYAPEEPPIGTSLSVPDPTSTNAVGTGEMPSLNVGGLRDTTGGKVDLSEFDTAPADVEWEMVFGLSSMGYRTHARGRVEIVGPVGTVSVERECYAHPGTEATESETPPGSLRFESVREHVERDTSLPAEPITVEFSGDVPSPDSLATAQELVNAHLDQFGDDYEVLVESVPVCQVCGEVPDPEAGMYVAEIPAFGGGLCWECHGKAVGEEENVRLTRRQAEADFLRQFDLSYGDIGDLMGIHAASVETHLRRAAKRHREAMATYPVVSGILAISSEFGGRGSQNSG